jgi:thymidylate synthase (FAD)
MSAKIISYTTSIKNSTDSLIDIIAYTARVSNPANQHNTSTNEKLVKYLAKNHHWSPFEMVNICIEIKTTRDIARQILRHRSFSFQEFSQRYAKVNDEFIIRDARLQDKKNRQNSIELEDESLNNEFKNKQSIIADQISELYNWALSKGIAKECARVVLPEGMTSSTLYMNGSLRSWIHYLNLRKSNGTQLEHMHMANLISKEIYKIFPMINEF